jgi:hypothetical protein
VEPNQIDILASPVLGDLEQIDQTQETRLSCQLRSDIRKTDRRDRIHLDLTFLHPVPVAHFNVGTHPYSDTASDLSAAYSFAKTLGERHEKNLTLSRD